MTYNDVIKRVKKLINDFAEENRLLRNEVEFSRKKYEEAIDEVITDFNEQVPRTSYTIDNFPSETCLLYGTAYWLLQGKIFLKSRNFVGIKDDGIYINAEENIVIYERLRLYLQKEYERRVNSWKERYNIEQLF